MSSIRFRLFGEKGVTKLDGQFRGDSWKMGRVVLFWLVRFRFLCEKFWGRSLGALLELRVLEYQG